jgi:hypothetical protein
MSPSHKPAAKLPMANHEALVEFLAELIDVDPFAEKSNAFSHCPVFPSRSPTLAISLENLLSISAHLVIPSRSSRQLKLCFNDAPGDFYPVIFCSINQTALFQ